MTVEKVIKAIKRMDLEISSLEDYKSTWAGSGKIDSGVLSEILATCDKIIDDYKAAKEALKKQVPKKAENNICPICKMSQLVDSLEFPMENGYCWNCGQALDWSEE